MPITKSEQARLRKLRFQLQEGLALVEALLAQDVEEPIPGIEKLPGDRIKYRDRRKHAELQDLQAPDFLKKMYPEFVSTGKIYQRELQKVDAPLLKALHNYCSWHGADIRTFAKPAWGQVRVRRRRKAAR